MKISSLIHTNVRYQNCSETELSPVQIDSRNIKNGDIFCALPGERCDGHKFVEKAIETGASAAIVSKNTADTHPEWHSLPLIICDSPLDFLQELAHQYTLTLPARMIGITGSSGKTSTRQLITTVISQTFNTVQSLKNFNNHIGFPLSLLEWKSDHQLAVMEMGASAVGEISALCKLHAPDFSIITSIAPAHLAGFGSIENIQQTKFELFDHTQAGGILFINNNDERIRQYSGNQAQRVTFGIDTEADFSFSVENIDEFSRYILRWDSHLIHLRSMGKGQAMNAAAAIAVAKVLGLNDTQIIDAIEAFLPASDRGRLQTIHERFFIDDSYNANPQSVTNALDLLGNIRTSGKKFFIFGDMLELGDSEQVYHQMIGQAIAQRSIDYLFSFGHRSEWTVKEARRSGMTNALHFNDKATIVATLSTASKPGDIIYVKGSRSMAMETIIQSFKEQF